MTDNHLCSENKAGVKITWDRAADADNPSWVIDRLQIFYCPFCKEELSRPDKKICSCGADEVIKNSESYSKAFMMDRMIEDFGTVKCKVRIVRVYHDQSCLLYELEAYR